MSLRAEFLAPPACTVPRSGPLGSHDDLVHGPSSIAAGGWPVREAHPAVTHYGQGPW